MVNSIINGIAKAIKIEFDCDVFTEELEQGLTNCFFIQCLSQKEKSQLDRRFLVEHTFVITYFPFNNTAECWEVLSKLNRLLELIQLQDGSYIKGTNRSGEIRQGVLHFFVNYDFYMVKCQEPNAYMKELEIYEKANK